MNIPLAREIYGGVPWAMDLNSLMAYKSLLFDIRNGLVLDKEIKNNSISFAYFESNTKLITRPWQLNNKDAFNGIGVIDLNGPITLNGGESSYGMNQLSNMMLEMSKDDRVKGFVIITDSGGGSSAAVEVMVDAILEVRKTKEVYSLIPKGGMAGSAAYGIISATKEIYSESEMNIVGSVGTMIQFSGFEANKKDKMGMKHITVYATKSTEKNKAFEEALNNDNYTFLVNDLLDPINENFINLVGNNRPILKSIKYDDGHTVFAKDAVGTFIDGFSNLDQIVNKILNTNKLNFNIMTKEELKNSYPDVFNSVLNDGIKQERERVKIWLTYVDIDKEQSINGVNSGEELTNSSRESLQIKAIMAKNVSNLEIGSPKLLTTEESESLKETNEESELKESFNFNLL